jgi:hypothetical protein
MEILLHFCDINGPALPAADANIRFLADNGSGVPLRISGLRGR